MLFKAGITKAEIDAAMAVVVNNNIFNTSGGDIVEVVEGRLRTIYPGPGSVRVKEAAQWT